MKNQRISQGSPAAGAALAVTQPLGLDRYDTMCTAIAECERVDEAKDIRDKALALEKYMAQAENLDAERLAINVRLRAERRCGELLRDMKASGERASEHRPTEVSHAATLPALGISRNQASRFQQLADIPEADFEAALAEPQKQSTAGLIRRAKPVEQERMDPTALWLWGRVRDFERDGALEQDPRDLLPKMTPAMAADVRRMAPVIAAWFELVKTGEQAAH